MTTSDNSALGIRVRELRAVTGLSMRNLAARAGVSAGYISQIEHGQANPSLTVLRSIAETFGVPWLELFQSPTTTGRVLRAADRPRILTDGGVTHYEVTQPPLGNVEVLVTEYAPGQGTGDEGYTHGESQEICLVTRGRLQITVDGETTTLATGDSIEYRTNVPHAVHNPGPDPAEAVWVVSPPSFPGSSGRSASSADA
ncbi:XRE family transcriptional regulator [Isoptericola chiayiensis]|uniref:XRE family transcriptional regulator n=1 Tax=Isoptericola chiayiensis TaxID=579446 RepID=A0ABP8YKG5_9MICO|nr:cupin domain-containing protein [Isoptericola chiayiensis]NOW00537.1 transcriptional regulator with XRE-family HTH domain [Isoptericola chiayiensis]